MPCRSTAPGSSLRFSCVPVLLRSRPATRLGAFPACRLPGFVHGLSSQVPLPQLTFPVSWVPAGGEGRPDLTVFSVAGVRVRRQRPRRGPAGQCLRFLCCKAFSVVPESGPRAQVAHCARFQPLQRTNRVLGRRHRLVSMLCGSGGHGCYEPGGLRWAGSAPHTGDTAFQGEDGT